MSKTIIVPTDPAVIKAIKDAGKEFSDCCTRVAAEKDQIKAIIEMVSEKYELPKPFVGKLFKQYHDNSFDKTVTEMEDFQTLYETIFR